MNHFSNKSKSIHLFRCLPFPFCALLLFPVLFSFLSTGLWTVAAGESYWPLKNIAGSDIEFWVFTFAKVSSSSSVIGWERLSPRGVAGADSDTGFLQAVKSRRFSADCERDRFPTGEELPVEQFSWTDWSTELVSSISMASAASSTEMVRATVVLLGGGDCSSTLANASAWEVVRRPVPWTGDKHCSGVGMAAGKEAWAPSCDISPIDCACVWGCSGPSTPSFADSFVWESVGDSSCPGPKLT